MSEKEINQIDSEKLNSLKRLTAIVYLCQVLTFFLAGLPLLIGAGINFMKQDEVRDTFLESHFDWQIKTVWMALVGFSLSGMTYYFGVGIFILIATVVLMVFRIVAGWNALNSGQPIRE